MANRINRAIELLEQGQPIYYTGSHNGTVGSFEQGKADAQTWADYISYDMEAAPYDVAGLSAYMKGLAAGGPTRTGHKTPAVIVNVAVRGTDEASVRANEWMFEQVLATGVHGILLCHATTAGAVRAFVAFLQEDPRFADIQPKESWSATQPFRKMRVKVKREIIRMNHPAIRPSQGRAPSVDARTAKRWLDLGARRLHVVDLNGASAGKPKNGAAIKAIISAVGDKLPIQLGGGIRDLDTIEQALAGGTPSPAMSTSPFSSASTYSAEPG